MDRKEKRKLRKQLRQVEIEQSESYQYIATIKRWMDEYYLDGIIGLIPVVGDAITKLFSLPFIYVSLIKVRSIPLTLAVMFNIMLDFLLGLFGFPIGDVIDFFFRSYNNNFELIVGFVEDDREVIRKVNEKAIWMAIGIFIIGYLAYIVISLFWAYINFLSSASDWLSGLINSFFSLFF